MYLIINIILISCLILIILGIVFIEYRECFVSTIKYSKSDYTDIIPMKRYFTDIDKTSLKEYILINKNQKIEIKDPTFIYADTDIDKDIFIIKDNNTIDYYIPGNIYEVDNAKLEIFFYNNPFKLYIKKK